MKYTKKQKEVFKFMRDILESNVFTKEEKNTIITNLTNRYF